MPSSILLIEDDPLIGQGVQISLRKRGFIVKWVRDGTGGLQNLACENTEVIVLDLLLPGQNGLQLLFDYRAAGCTVPVIIATARDKVSDRVAGLDAGADDYIVKPYAIDELAARIRALSRRVDGRASEIIEYGELRMDTRARNMTVQGRNVSLTPTEFLIIQSLLKSSGNVVTRAQLNAMLEQPGGKIAGNTVQVHIHALRKKIGSECIVTVHGIGYALRKIEDQSM